MRLAGVEFPLDSTPVASDVRPKRILRLVAAAWGVDMVSLCGQRRTRKVAQARQVAMYLLRTYTDLSLAAVGTMLGGRDHTTVIHGVRKISQDPRLQSAAEALVPGFGAS